MNKDIRAVIAESFNEVFKKMLAEDAAKLAASLSPEELATADNMIKKVEKRGASGGLNHSYLIDDQGRKKDFNESDFKVFNYVTEKLIEDFKQTGNPNIKAALQTAFFPTPGTRMSNAIKGKWRGKDVDNVEDALSSSYEQLLMNPEAFEKAMASYKSGDGRFGAWVQQNLNNRVANYFKGYTGEDGGDVLAKGAGVSMETPFGDDLTLGDKLSGTADLGADFADPEKMTKQKEMLAIALGWLKNNVSEKQYVAFREVLKGHTNKEIAEEYPEIFPDTGSMPGHKMVAKNFSQLMQRTQPEIGDDGQKTGQKISVMDEISAMISSLMGTEVSLGDIIPLSVKQQTSMDPSWEEEGLGGRVSKVSSPEIKSAQKDLKATFEDLGPELLSSIGVNKEADYNSQVKVNKIVDRLQTMGMDMEANDVYTAYLILKDAQAKSSDFGKVKSFTSDVPDMAAEAFNGLSEALIARVMKRLSE